MKVCVIVQREMLKRERKRLADRKKTETEKKQKQKETKRESDRQTYRLTEMMIERNRDRENMKKKIVLNKDRKRERY